MDIKLMTFDIYADVFNSKFNQIKKYFGSQTGISFSDCCEKLAETDIDFARKFNLNNLTWNGYELYGTFK